MYIFEMESLLTLPNKIWTFLSAYQKEEVLLLVKTDLCFRLSATKIPFIPFILIHIP